MKNVVLLGSTGSIGKSTIKVVQDLSDRLRIVGLAAGNNASLLLEQTKLLKPTAISIKDEKNEKELRKTLGSSTLVYSGDEGLLQLATFGRNHSVCVRICRRRLLE